ncbi:MAG: nicotinate phosphoribosyltransferase [Finegoldia sp.]|nr:nicotinate phosphoribosyltransferase [Finegoldia sp.]
MNWKNYDKLSILSDFYEFTMMNGYLDNNLADQIAYFDMFFRKVPDKGGFAIACGLEEVIRYIENISFSEDEIKYFKDKKIFSDKFLDYLKNFKFACDIWAVPEGSVVFPNEPILIVRGPVIQAQLLETMILLTINHQSLIATKAKRIVEAADGRLVMEFGARRAHGVDSSVLGARAAYIGGVNSTSNTLTDLEYSVPASGTMAHSWIMMFDNEYEAFKAYAKTYPRNCSLLVDTYNVLKSGIPNAIRVFDEFVKPNGYDSISIRIDSGDLAYLTKKARKLLDEAGYEDCKIIVSNSLDEYTITDLLQQKAEIDGFGVGERLIVAKSDAVFGGVYKLVANEDKDGNIIPKIKISENVEKITTPAFKDLYRLYDKESGKAEADLITLKGEKVDDSKPIEIFHPIHTWKRKNLNNFRAEKRLVKIYDKGKLVYELPKIDQIRKHAQEEVDSLWDEVKRFENPHDYFVDLSQNLWDIKNKLLNQTSK